MFLTIKGQVSNNEDLENFRSQIGSLLKKTQSTAWVVNLHELVGINSSAIGQFISMHQKLQQRNTRIVIHSLDSRMRSLFGITRLDSVFPVVDNEEDALKLLENEMSLNPDSLLESEDNSQNYVMALNRLSPSLSRKYLRSFITLMEQSDLEETDKFQKLQSLHMELSLILGKIQEKQNEFL